jgi:hypothetical protein
VDLEDGNIVRLAMNVNGRWVFAGRSGTRTERRRRPRASPGA